MNDGKGEGMEMGNRRQVKGYEKTRGGGERNRNKGAIETGEGGKEERKNGVRRKGKKENKSRTG